MAAALVAQSLRVERLVEAERQRLAREQGLRQELSQRYQITTYGSSRPMQQSTSRWRRWPVPHHCAEPRRVGHRKEMAPTDPLQLARAEKPFVKVSCAALPESLIESELFGYEKAPSPTRARERKAARAGPLGTCSSTRSASCRRPPRSSCCGCCRARVRAPRRRRALEINVRLVAATNKDLELAVQAGSFVRTSTTGSTCSRSSCALARARPDIPLLADHFARIRRRSRQGRRRTPPRDRHADGVPLAGNVRELETCIDARRSCARAA